MQPPTSSFKAAPGQDELAAMNRDLRFHAVVNPNPRTLSSQQIDQFNRDGYLKPFRIFAAKEADELRSYFDRLLAKVLAEGGEQLFHQHGAREVWPGVRHLDAPASRGVGARPPGRKRHRLGVALLLQDAGRR